MANEGTVEVRNHNGVLEHRHPGYDGGWHPVTQTHQNHAHENNGITGNEKPNRRNPESLGMKDPSRDRDKGKPQRQYRPVGTSRDRKPTWEWDGSMTVTDYFKQVARAKPKTKLGRMFYTAFNATQYLYTSFRRRMDERDAKASEQGFEDAFRAFDKRFTFHGTDDFDRLSASDIRRIDKDLEEMARTKYREYGGADLKGRRDPESLRRKAEIRTYIEIQRRLREQAQRVGRRSQTSPTSSGTKPTSARELRERNRREGTERYVYEGRGRRDASGVFEVLSSQKGR